MLVHETTIPHTPNSTTTRILHPPATIHYTNVDLHVHIVSQPPTETASNYRSLAQYSRSKISTSILRTNFHSTKYFADMADVTTNAPPVPTSAVEGGKRPSGPREPARDPQHKRMGRQNQSRQAQQTTQTDGTVSDSVTSPVASPNAKRQFKQKQSVASGGQAWPHQGDMGRGNGARARPVSLGGPMLPMTPAKEQAYAGPTFHASPAPSSLPVPKFFSKSAPNVAGPLQDRMEGEKTPEKQASSPEMDVVSPAVPREVQQSPLDMFFKAHKEEKQRSFSNGMLSPEMAARRPMPSTEPRNLFQRSGKNVFLHELDGNNGEMPSPKTVPANERPAPAERAHSSPSVRPLSGADDEQRAAHTKSLKDLLFNNVNGVQPPNNTPAQPQRRVQSDVHNFNAPSPFNRPASSSGPSTPAYSNQANHYGLHYGNRNLSPMFNAARNETPSRPSSLRQELPNGESPAPPSQGPPQPRQMPQIDSNSNSFARDFLNQQAQHARPTSLPQLPFSPNAPPSGAAQRGVPGGDGLAFPSPRTTNGAQDLRSMEDDIKRMLRLNVSG
ncbi:hypothetical protein LTR35_004955 [Friedmanniomyces endolithicus]|uniref:Uncharacterized protein n=1 Tax=Friedmanniomyces endolithicus TaxID=329885 RepID=A0AAN6G2U0_9PEZI|nr:hypothetical protein LTR35_004955 [Friedmanniomyces endolithicus]KAK0298910.1 hypothetical protein LTS00_002672 [Friedmanniomyces endolithicus]KAK0328902.1 hypothetical protein LTR82_000835 [Friedmanniomyces endolithicus]KAK1003871.1 hypothetical protein LTR54_007635 [Friedmanniomyces endolithicus]